MFNVDLLIFSYRVLPEVLYTGSVNITNCTCITFSLPQLPTTILPSDKPVDVRVRQYPCAYECLCCGYVHVCKSILLNHPNV